MNRDIQTLSVTLVRLTLSHTSIQFSVSIHPSVWCLCVCVCGIVTYINLKLIDHSSGRS